MELLRKTTTQDGHVFYIEIMAIEEYVDSVGNSTFVPSYRTLDASLVWDDSFIPHVNQTDLVEMLNDRSFITNQW